MKHKRKLIINSAWIIAIVLVLINMVAIFHAYKFTHFAESELEKTVGPTKLTTAAKAKTLLLGVNNPRPENQSFPSRDHETIILQSNRKIECWRINAENPKGTIILYHGFAGEKSSMLDKADIFLNLGYNTLLVDFMGAGGSEGNQTTIGFLEAEQVSTTFDYLNALGEKNIYLFGTSMGAIAIMKSINDHQINPKGIILECPFGSMYETVCARFKSIQVPTFPMAGLLVFWGGAKNGFWAFGHNPTEYAKNISCPTLLLHGAKDEKVSRAEIDAIFNNLAGEKELSIYPNAGHENYLTMHQKEWQHDVKVFLGSE